MYRRPFLKGLLAMTISIFGIQPKTPSPSKNNVQFYWRWLSGQTPQAQPFMQVDGAEYPFAVGLTGTNLNIAVGTWTPVLIGLSAAGSAAYSIQSGTYLKVGPFVSVSGILATSDEHTGTGGMAITGLPYASASDVALAHAAITNGYTLNSANGVGVFGVIVNGESRITLREQLVAVGAMTDGAMDCTKTDVGFKIYFSASYLTS